MWFTSSSISWLIYKEPIFFPGSILYHRIDLNVFLWVYIQGKYEILALYLFLV